MGKSIKKYIPLDEEFMKRSISDVLFAYIQVNSYKDRNGTWFCYKPRNFYSLARETLGFKSVNTVKNKYNNLLEGGFVKEGEVIDLSGDCIDAIIIPTKTNYYEKVDIKVLELLALTTKERAVKIYSYLLNKFRVYRYGHYIFTYGELITNCLGCKNTDDAKSLRLVRNILELLTRLELIQYTTIRQGDTYRQLLVNVSTKLPTLSEQQTQEE